MQRRLVFLLELYASADRLDVIGLRETAQRQIMERLQELEYSYYDENGVLLSRLRLCLPKVLQTVFGRTARDDQNIRSKINDFLLWQVRNIQRHWTSCQNNQTAWASNMGLCPEALQSSARLAERECKVAEEAQTSRAKVWEKMSWDQLMSSSEFNQGIAPFATLSFSPRNKHC